MGPSLGLCNTIFLLSSCFLHLMLLTTFSKLTYTMAYFLAFRFISGSQTQEIVHPKQQFAEQSVFPSSQATSIRKQSGFEARAQDLRYDCEWRLTLF